MNPNHPERDSPETEGTTDGTKRQSARFALITALLSVGLSALLFTAVLRNGAAWRDAVLRLFPAPGVESIQEPMEDLQARYKRMERERADLDKKLDRLVPKNHYLVVNTTGNTFRLYKGGEMVREGLCSTGSYTVLKAGDKMSWTFKTPRGMYRIQGKISKPIWRKPDWAFVEEGLPIPPANSQLRYEAGVLGNYAMSLGHGYLIHGTLYQRFLGMPVTHGCVRLGDDDLEAVFRSMQVGSRVFIY
jgi:hypothetical protein